MPENKFKYLGKGPGATGEGRGWNMRKGLYFRCSKCGYMMAADPPVSGRCHCGALRMDADYCRLGSTLGDRQIEVYELEDQ